MLYTVLMPQDMIPPLACCDTSVQPKIRQRFEQLLVKLHVLLISPEITFSTGSTQKYDYNSLPSSYSIQNCPQM